MHRPVGSMVLLMMAPLAGCAEHKMPMGPPQKPEPPGELARLNRLVGAWTGTAEMISPSPEEMSKYLPEGESMPSTFGGGSTAEWTLGGMWLREEGWYEMGPEMKSTYHAYWTWDAKARKYRSFFMSDWGEIGEGWGQFDSTGNTMQVRHTGVDASGMTKQGQGTMTFVDDDTVEWEFSESGGHGTMKMRGTSQRVK